MRGLVVSEGAAHGLAAVQVEDKSYSVLEAAPGAFAKGDALAGNLQSLGPLRVQNETQGTRVEAVVQDVYCSRDRAFQMLREG